MTLTELAEITGSRVRITRYPRGKRRVTAHLDHVEVRTGRNGGLLAWVYGDDTSERGALADLARKLRGQRIVVDAAWPWRAEYMVPATLRP